MEHKRGSDGNTREAFLIRKKRRSVKALHEAVESGTVDDVVETLDAADNDVMFQLRGRNALQLAASRGNPDICEVLCDAEGADLSCADIQDNSLLHLACNGSGGKIHPDEIDEAASASVVHILADRGAPLTTHNEDGLAPVHLAALQQLPAALGALLQCTDSVGLSSQSGRTALHYAVTIRDNERVLDQLLSTVGCPLNAKDTQGKSALHLCVGRNEATSWRLQYARTLLEAGCSTEVADIRHRTALVTSVLEKDVAMTTLLLQHSADYNIRVREKHLESLLSMAFVLSCPQITDSLISLPDLDINRQASNGRTALHYCVEQSSDFRFYCSDSTGVTLPYLLRKMLESGADPNVRDTVGETPLHLAARIGDSALWDLLVGAGADVRLLTAEGNSVLHLAVTHLADTHFFLRVMNCGADLDHVNFLGQHALHVAIHKRVADGLLRVAATRVAAAELVAAAGPKHRNSQWRSHKSSIGGEEDKDAEGGSPLGMAVRGGQAGWVELLCAYEDVEVNVADPASLRSPLAAACALQGRASFEPILRSLLSRPEIEPNGAELVAAGSGLYASIPLINLFKYQTGRPAELVWSFVRSLLSLGADPNLTTGGPAGGPHCTHFVFQFDCPVRLIDLLVAHGAVVSSPGEAVDGLLSAAVASPRPVESLLAALPLVTGVYPNSLFRRLEYALGAAADRVELSSALAALSGQVDSLQGYCRRVLRGAVLPRPTVGHVRKLPIPSKLHDYLLHRELWADLNIDDELF